MRNQLARTIATFALSAIVVSGASALDTAEIIGTWRNNGGYAEGVDLRLSFRDTGRLRIMSDTSEQIQSMIESARETAAAFERAGIDVESSYEWIEYLESLEPISITSFNYRIADDEIRFPEFRLPGGTVAELILVVKYVDPSVLVISLEAIDPSTGEREVVEDLLRFDRVPESTE